MDGTDNEQTPQRRIAFLGPSGTFGEEALNHLKDIPDFEPVLARSMPEAMVAAHEGEVEMALIPLENSIEGTVNISLDTLIFDTDLLVQQEVVLPIKLCLVAPHGVRLRDIRRVASFSVAAAQCRAFLAKNIPDAEVVASNSTADAVRQVSRTSSRSTAAIGTRFAAELYGLNVLEADVSDFAENQTRFVLLARNGVPAPTGHDKTSVVVFQSADKPGSLHAILGQFSARNINLVKLESRPTKRGLGDYCFVVDLEGHVNDEVIADCLRDLHVQARSVKFLGSYPATGATAPRRRRDAQTAWKEADTWITGLRSQVAPSPKRSRPLKVVK